MAGYNQFSMSNNAVAAYEEGKAPLTIAAKEAAKKAAITQKQAREIAKNIGPCEWHHSSKFYNRVQFYDIAEIVKVADMIKVCSALPSDWQEQINASFNMSMDSKTRGASRDAACERLGKLIGKSAEYICDAYYAI